MLLPLAGCDDAKTTAKADSAKADGAKAKAAEAEEKPAEPERSAACTKAWKCCEAVTKATGGDPAQQCIMVEMAENDAACDDVTKSSITAMKYAGKETPAECA